MSWLRPLPFAAQRISGIGDTEALKELISWAARQGLSVVQILPINETGGDSSPYCLLSAMAIEPTTIATFPGILPDLTQEDFDRITARYDLPALRQGPHEYREVKKLKRQLLYAGIQERSALEQPIRRERWRSPNSSKTTLTGCQDYATHRALVSWHEESETSDRWPREHRSPTAVRVWIESLTPPASDTSAISCAFMPTCNGPPTRNGWPFASTPSARASHSWETCR